MELKINSKIYSVTELKQEFGRNSLFQIARIEIPKTTTNSSTQTVEFQTVQTSTVPTSIVQPSTDQQPTPTSSTVNIPPPRREFVRYFGRFSFRQLHPQEGINPLFPIVVEQEPVNNPIEL